MRSPSVWATYAGLPSGVPNPCGWYRVLLPLAALREHGWDARAGIGHAGPPPESETAGTFVLQSGDQPGAAAILAERGKFQRTVYETDDDVFSIPPAIAAAYAAYTRPETRQAVIANMRACHVVTVTTEPLAESVRASTGHPDVRVVPNCIPDAVLGLPRRRQPGRTVIGWTGSGARDADFGVARDAVRDVLETVPGTEMHFMGTDYRYLLPARLPARHTHPLAVSISWRDWFGGFDFDIALAPLADIPFNRSRSALKALEAMALGIPVLASDAGPYRGIVTDGVTGYLCRPGDWGKRLRELALDAGAREEMGANARRAAREHVISAGWRRWARAYVA